MTYRIEFTPERLTVVADLARCDIRALIEALTVVTPLIGQDQPRPEEITRAPKAAKALRAAKAEKEIRPEPPVPAIREQDEAPAQRARSNSVPADRDEKLKALWAAGVTTHVIADRLNMGSPSNVSFRAKYLGLPSRGRGGARARSAPADGGGFDPAYYARKAIIPDNAGPATGAAITAALMGDPSHHGPSLGVERAGPQRDGGGA